MGLAGAKGKLVEALQGQEGLPVRELAVETGLREGTIAQTLNRHPKLFERGPRGWLLTPRGIELSRNDDGEEVTTSIGGIAPVEVRKAELSKIAMWPLPREAQVTVRHKIEAIAELNKMEHVYEPGGERGEVKVVFIIGKGYQELPQLRAGEVKDA